MDQISYFNKTVASKDMSGYYLLLNGEFAYNKSYSVGFDFGSIKRLDCYPMGALSTLYICFSVKKYDSDFIKTYFDSLKWYKEIYMIAAEGARNHGLLNVPTEDFFATRHTLPTNPKEQKKIAAFMNLLERRIDAQRRLVETLKSYKRGVSTAIFSQKITIGKEGDLFPKWEIISIGDVFSERVERAVGDEELLAVTITSGVQKRSELDLKDNSSDDKSNYKIVCPGDLPYNTMRMWQGASGASPYKGIVSPAYTILRLNDPYNDDVWFWAAYFKERSMLNEFQKYSQGLTSDTWNLKYDQIKSIAIRRPCMEEQKLITRYLKTIDDHINSHSAVLIALSKMKAFFLKEMFI